VTRAAPASSESDARSFIARVSDHKASHNCWAYIISPGTFRYSDDGEPGGTAGENKEKFAREISNATKGMGVVEFEDS